MFGQQTAPADSVVTAGPIAGEPEPRAVHAPLVVIEFVLVVERFTARVHIAHMTAVGGHRLPVRAFARGCDHAVDEPQVSVDI